MFCVNCGKKFGKYKYCPFCGEKNPYFEAESKEINASNENDDAKSEQVNLSEDITVLDEAAKHNEETLETEEEIVSDISSDLILENKSTNEENVLNGEEDIAINAENYIEEQVSKVQDESKATVVEPEEELSCKEKPESIETEDDTVLVDNEKKQNITDESSGDDEQDLPENKEDNVLEVTSPDDSTEDQSDSDQKSFANNKELSSEEEKEFAVNQERVAQQPDDEATEVTGKKPETSTNDRDNDSFTEKSNEEKVAESDSLAAVVIIPEFPEPSFRTSKAIVPECQGRSDSDLVF